MNAEPTTAMTTTEAEPKPLDETEAAIASMLRENTGTHFLDSGGAYGRNWQRNQLIEAAALVRGDEASVDFRYGEINVTLRIGPWLVQRAILDTEADKTFRLMERYLDITGRSYHYLEMMRLFPSFLACYRARQRLRADGIECECGGEGSGPGGQCEPCNGSGIRSYTPHMKLDEREDVFRLDGDLHDIGRVEEVAGIYGEGDPITVNTYNGEDLLSQVIQYVFFTIGGEEFTILQIHGGCDVRGGYTRPRVFSAGIDDSPSIFDNDKAAINCTGKGPFAKDPNQITIDGATEAECEAYWHTDDANHWYRNGECGRGAGTQLERYETVQLVSATDFDAFVADGNEPEGGIIEGVSSHARKYAGGFSGAVAKGWVPGKLVFTQEDVEVNGTPVKAGTGFCPCCGGILKAWSY